MIYFITPDKVVRKEVIRVLKITCGSKMLFVSNRTVLLLATCLHFFKSGFPDERDLQRS